MEYDKEHGFPIRVFIDKSLEKVDEKTRYEVTDFAIITSSYTKIECQKHSDWRDHQVYCGRDPCSCQPHPPPKCGPLDTVAMCMRNTCEDFEAVCSEEGRCELQQERLQR